METLTAELMAVLFQNGADLAGAGSLAELPEAQRYSLPIGVSVAVKYPKEVISGIFDLPTPEYKQWYDSLNRLLDQIVTAGADFLVRQGYRAVAKSRAEVGGYGEDCQTLLPVRTPVPPGRFTAPSGSLGWNVTRFLITGSAARRPKTALCGASGSVLRFAESVLWCVLIQSGI